MEYKEYYFVCEFGLHNIIFFLERKKYTFNIKKLNINKTLINQGRSNL